MSVAGLRQLSSLVEHSTSTMSPFSRATGDGRVIAVQADEDSVSVRLVPTQSVFEEVLRPSGWSVEQSHEGQFETQLVRRLGGPEASTANQPAIRAVLHKASRSRSASPLPALVQKALDCRDEWPGGFGAPDPRRYSEDTIRFLLARKLLLPVAHVRCTECASNLEVRPDDLGTELRCDFCEATFPLGLALALGRNKDPWKYRLPPSVDPKPLMAALPVMASLSILHSAHRAGSSPVLPHVLGLIVSDGSWSCELDVAATVIDGPATVFVIGEAKGGSEEFDANDIANLTKIQTELRSSRHETVLMFATTRRELTNAERDLLRSVCDRAPLRLLDRYGSQLAFPIVFTAEDLSHPWASEDHPWRWGDPSQIALAGVAEQSCRKNLGLIEINCRLQDDERPFDLTWSD